MIKRVPWIFWTVLAVLVAAVRFCHVRVLWVEEAYPSVAAKAMLSGVTLYRDLWFDKPPWFAGIYMVWGAQEGWPLRTAGTLYVLLCCWTAYGLAVRLWSAREGVFAAGLVGFFLSFGVPAAVMALTPDLLMIPFHLGGVLLAVSGFPLLAGLAAGAAVLFNSKGVFVLAACLLFSWRDWRRIAAGFAGVQAALALWLLGNGSSAAYWDQVWAWGALYSRFPLTGDPISEGLRRTVNWIGFHACAMIGAAYAFRHEPTRWRWAVWIGLSIVAVWMGFRYFPRYFFHVLPVVCVLGARGLCLMPSRARMACLALLLVPAIRYAPAHWKAATGDPAWADLALFRDAQEASAKIRVLPGKTVFVWGYRPEIYLLSERAVGAPFLDSQPVSGVLADRHLVDSTVAAPEWRARNMPRLAASRPEVIVDGLGPLNPALALDRQRELGEWLAKYHVVDRSSWTRIYRLRQESQ